MTGNIGDFPHPGASPSAPARAPDPEGKNAMLGLRSCAAAAVLGPAAAAFVVSATAPHASAAALIWSDEFNGAAGGAPDDVGGSGWDTASSRTTRTARATRRSTARATS
jgi:hypothetical protein